MTTRDTDWEGVRLHVVTGKGGTGKTTVAGALALAVASAGQRVLLMEVEGRQGIAQLFDVPPLPYEERKVAVAPAAGSRPGGEVLALVADAESALLVGQRRAVKDLGDPLPSLDLDEQDPLPARGEREGQRGGDRRLARSALAGDDVQPHALPVRVPRTHVMEAIRAPALGPPPTCPADRKVPWPAARSKVTRLVHGDRRTAGKEVFAMIAVLVILVILVVAGLVATGRAMRVVQQYEQGIVFRFGKVLPGTRGPGLHVIRPFGDRMQKVNMQIIAMAIPAQEGITRDNVSVRVDAVVYFRVVDPIKATVNVQNYMFAVSQQAQTSLRSIIGQSEMDQLLAERATVNKELRRIIDEPTEGPWGVRVERVEIKDVSLPEQMKRSMSRQAEAERERRARIITADGEYQASKRLAAAANVMARDPAALQLRLLQTVVEVAAEKNSTLVMPVPVELLRFFDKFTPAQPAGDKKSAEDSASLADFGDAEVAEVEAEIAGKPAAPLAIPDLPAIPEIPADVTADAPISGEPALQRDPAQLDARETARLDAAEVEAAQPDARQ